MSDGLIALLKTEGGTGEWSRVLESILVDEFKVNLLKYIFDDHLVYRPENKPFVLYEFNNGENELTENDYNFLKNLAEESICEYNKARIYDFLWFANKDFNAALQAYQYYEEYVSKSELFDYNFVSVNRMISIYQVTKNQSFNRNRLHDLLKRTLQQEKEGGKPYYLIETCYKYAYLENSELINIINTILNGYADNSKEYQLIGKYTDLMEKILRSEKKIKAKKLEDDPDIVKARKRKVQALLAAADCFSSDNAVAGFQKVRYWQKAANVLKTLSGTEEERKQLLREISKLQIKAVGQVPVFSTSIDNTESVKNLISSIERLDKKELLCYFALFPPLPNADEIRKKVLKKNKISTLFPSAIMNNAGKKVAISKPLYEGQTVNESVLEAEMEHTARRQIDLISQGIIGNVRNILVSKYQVEEADIKEIIEQSVFVSEERGQSYTKGLLAGFRGDMMTALCILIPQVEKSIRDIAEICGEVAYNIKEDLTEELKTFNGILDLPKVKECMDEDLLLTLRTVFCSKFGFNMRNEIAHGTVSDSYYHTFGALYTWWLVFRLCYMFCGVFRNDMLEQVSKKLNDVVSEKC